MTSLFRALSILAFLSVVSCVGESETSSRTLLLACEYDQTCPDGTPCPDDGLCVVEDPGGDGDADGDVDGDADGDAGGDSNHGHGNDADGHDEDNPGRGHQK